VGGVHEDPHQPMAYTVLCQFSSHSGQGLSFYRTNTYTHTQTRIANKWSLYPRRRRSIYGVGCAARVYLCHVHFHSLEVAWSLFARWRVWARWTRAAASCASRSLWPGRCKRRGRVELVW